MVEASVEISIPFHDVDTMRVAWHGHYLKYLEVARCELLQTIGYDYPEMEESGFVWPVIEVHVRYAQPLRFRQKIVVHARITEWENRLKIVYTIRDSETGKRLTKAHTVQVAVDLATGEMQYASPDILLEKMDVQG